MKFLESQGADFTAINYFLDPIPEDTLRDLLIKLEIPVSDLFRKKEPRYKELGIDERKFTEEELIKILAENPDLIERPIVVRGNKAVLGRPPENILKLF
jgi:arsenate reductase